MKKTGLTFLWLSLVVLILDLASKYVIVQNFALYEVKPIMPHFNLAYARNYGAAFSFLADHGGWRTYFFLGLALAISIGLVVMLAKSAAQQKLANSAYALIIGGAIGNAIDRFYHGFVVDFLDFYWGNAHFATFNVADIAISVGAGLLVLESLLDSRKKKNKEVEESKAEWKSY